MGHRRKRRLHTSNSRSFRLERLEDRRVLATLTVNSPLDVQDSTDGVVTLREAIEAANSDTSTELGQTGSGADTIEFDASVFSTPQSIVLTNGELEISESLTINGPGQDVLTVNAEQRSRVLSFTSASGDLTVEGVTVTGGKTTGDNLSFYDSTYSGGGIYFGSNDGVLTLTNSTVRGNVTEGEGAAGGGIWTLVGATLVNSTVSENSTIGELAFGGGIAGSDLSLTDSTVSDNSTEGNYSTGGGIWSLINLTLTNSTVSGNHTSANFSDGGGIAANDGLTVTGSTIRDNMTTGEYSSGGGITSSANTTITDSTISGNMTTGDTTFGGGIYAKYGLTINNSTVSGNATTGISSDGGGIVALGNYFYYPTVSINNSTVAGNRAVQGTGGGLFAYYSYLDIANSIVSGNTGDSDPDDIRWRGNYDVTFDLNHSLVTTTAGLSYTGGNNVTGVDPLLGPLADNGGPTQTHALLAGSPAIDAGDPAAMPGDGVTPDFDQRGAPSARVVDGDGDMMARIDIGAFELQSVGPTVTGDFDNDGDYDCDDIDALVAEIAASTNQSSFDLTNDGLVNLDDRDEWLAQAGAANLPSGNPYLIGDANLSGSVDVSDRIVWNTSKFTFTAAWCSGDFNADGTVDVTDLSLLTANIFQSALLIAPLTPIRPIVETSHAITGLEAPKFETQPEQEVIDAEWNGAGPQRWIQPTRVDFVQQAAEDGDSSRQQDQRKTNWHDVIDVVFTERW